MAATTVSHRCWVFRYNLLLLMMMLQLLLLLLLSPDQNMVSGSTMPRTKSANTVAVNSIHRLDLSYLHRCGVADIADAIRGALEEQQNENTGDSTPKSGEEEEEKEEDSDPRTSTATTSNILDIDLTASLIGKNVSEILSSFQRFEHPSEDTRKDDENTDEGATELASSSMIVKLTARRNKLSPGEATAILEFLLKNGPTNETTTVTTTAIPIATEEEGEIKDDKDGNPLPETEVATSPENSDGETKRNDSDIQNDSGGEEKEAESPAEAESSTRSITRTRLRPAFVSIESLDLGWNNLGGGGGGASAGSRRSSPGARSLNLALRKLLAETERCPHTIRLDVCGLGPPACRDLAKGMVERYQNQKGGEDDLTNESLLSSPPPPPPPPPPLSLDLACNEGIGDVGVAALAAAIRTVTKQEGFRNPNNVQKEKKKKRRRKRKTTKQEPVQDGEDAPLEEETTEEKNTDAMEQQNDDQTAAAATPPPELRPTTRTILERLDLSGCDIGDAGAEALAIALTSQPLCVKHLDLSNNRITDQGAAALGEALEDSGFVESLDLSHNKDLGDNGAKKLALAFQKDGITRLILRSCNIRADGAAYFGTALQSVMSRMTKSSSASATSIISQQQQQRRRLIDLSGNPLGILSKKKKKGSKYSATALRSKATDTTKAYMNIIGKSLQKGLNSISGEAGGPDTLESDDEEERQMGEEADGSVKKCGALSLAEAFIRAGERVHESNQEPASDGNADPIQFELGLRHCSFDTRAAEALAAVLQESKEKYSRTKLSLDMAMNHVLEEDIIAALHGEDGYDEQLADMADVYLDALEVMREARERAMKAVQMAAARARAQAEEEASWGAVPPSTSSRYNDDYGDKWSNNAVDEDSDDELENGNCGRNLEEEYSDEDYW